MARTTARVAAEKKERILRAAIQRFGVHSYEDTSLRAIAADVGVDVAHVHRSFGSKEQLLVEALRSLSPVSEGLFAGPPSLLPSKFADELLADESVPGAPEVGVFAIFMRSLTSREASGAIRESIRSDFIEPLAQVIGPHSERRAGLVLAVLLGLGVLREVLRIEPLLDLGDGELKALTTQVLRGLMESADA